jgi:hypothetical protein
MEYQRATANVYLGISVSLLSARTCPRSSACVTGLSPCYEIFYRLFVAQFTPFFDEAMLAGRAWRGW